MAAAHTPNAMSTLILDYDPWRAGFYLRCGQFKGFLHLLFGGRIEVEITGDSRVTAIMHFGHFRGWHLAGLRPSVPLKRLEYDRYFRGDFPLARDGGQAGPVLVRQCAAQLELWFGCLPLEYAPTYHDTELAVAIWISSNEVAGIRLGMSSLEANYPFSSINISPGDVK